jgi:hypothetical protein
LTALTNKETGCNALHETLICHGDGLLIWHENFNKARAYIIQQLSHGLTAIQPAQPLYIPWLIASKCVIIAGIAGQNVYKRVAASPSNLTRTPPFVVQALSNKYVL